MIPHCVLEDDLVLYAIGDLGGPRRKHLEEHIALCPECRKRIGQYRIVQRHLRLLTRPEETERHRETLKQRILEESMDLPGVPARSRQRSFWRWQPALLVVVLLALGVMLATATEVTGYFPFSQFVGYSPPERERTFDESDLTSLEPPSISVRESLEVRDTGEPVPEEMQTPNELPLGLYLDESFVLENGSVTHYYLSRDHGFEVVIGLEDRETSRTQITGDETMMVRVNGVDVLVDRGRSGEANGLLWTDGDTLYTVFIVRAFGGFTVTPTELLSVAEAVIQ